MILVECFDCCAADNIIFSQSSFRLSVLYLKPCIRETKLTSSLSLPRIEACHGSFGGGPSSAQGQP